MILSIFLGGNKSFMCLETGEKKLEVGAIVSGKVTGIAKFGAFVEIAPQKTGLVHISEISNDFVRDIADYFKEGQIVNVKILSISPSGKIELSTKQAETQGAENSKAEQSNRFSGEKQPYRKPGQPAKTNSFEDMMAKFKKMSEDKLSGIAPPAESRRRRNFHNNNS